jgi:hypothetical protein
MLLWNHPGELMLNLRPHAVDWSGWNSRVIAQSSGRALGARHQSSVWDDFAVFAPNGRAP